MGKNLVIVAIPEEQDRVWKISSEKIPHLTLLFLGDADSNPHVEDIVLFVEHAVEICQHGPFYLDVDSRGTLGSDNADVVFFSKRSWNLKWIKQFRSQLLQNENIRTAYDAADQYDEWQPHLTLGYPATPAKELDDPNYNTIYSVCFDRIAVWVDDFDGPEFKLEWPDRELEYGDSAVAYSDVGKSAVADILEHHGVKVEPVEDSVAQTVDLGKEFVAHQSVLDNPDLAAQIKAKLQSILDDVTGDADKDINLFGDPIIRVKLQSVLSDFYKDPNVTEAMVYSALGELAMEHHGIKGMHWGIRRDHPSGPEAVHPTATSRVPAGDRRKTKIKTEGGQNIDAHPDAIKVAESKAKLKRSGPAALSNQELREVSNRVRLENEALVLTSRKGAQFVKRQLLGGGESVTRAGVRAGTKEGLKKAGATGVAALV